MNPGGASRAELGLDLSGELREGRLVGPRKIRQHLAIDLDGRLLQAVHERRVGHPVLAHGGVDPRDPQGAKLALALLAVAVRILLRLHHRLFGDVEDVSAAAAESLGLADDFLVLGVCGYAAFYSWHGNLLGSRPVATAQIRKSEGPYPPPEFIPLGVRQHR